MVIVMTNITTKCNNNGAVRESDLLVEDVADGFADNAGDKHSVGSGSWVLASTSLKLAQFGGDEPESDWPFCEMVCV